MKGASFMEQALKNSRGKPFPKYNVTKCPGCGLIQVTSAKKSMTYKSCNHQAVLRARHRWHVIRYWGGNDPELAAEICRKIKGGDYGKRKGIEI